MNTPTTKRCPACKEVLSRSKFSFGKKIASECRKCMNLRARNLRVKDRELERKKDRDRYRKNKERRRKTNKKYYWANREKRSAYAKVYRAVFSGKIKRPNSCDKCGTNSRLEGHHKDYSKPLEIIWLCIRCHKNIHQEKLRDPR